MIFLFLSTIIHRDIHQAAKADWLVGMNGSRLFSIRYNAKLNTGRVQTPTLAMIVQRDHDVKNFVKQKYFTVELDCGAFTASSERIDDESAAQKVALTCNGKTATVIEAKRENKKSNPPKLYDLTTLQRDANKLLGYTAQQTFPYTRRVLDGAGMFQDTALPFMVGASSLLVLYW